jgi:hypothetical protein
MASSPIAIVDELKRRNASSRAAWEPSSGHRAHVTHLLREAAGALLAPRRLCVLGAGHCNDLALGMLLDAYDEVHLVDLDADSLAAGVARQAPTQAPLASKRLKSHGCMDVTGCLMQLAQEINPATADPARVGEWIERIKNLPPFPQPSPFHVVVSLGMLTQIAECALLLVGGPDHPRGNDLLFALRNHHLRKLLEMTRPGGEAILITDVVSSFTFPNLPILDDADLPSALYEQVAMKNFFTGANPYALDSLVRNDPVLKPRVAAVEMLAPWRWNQGNRSLLMSGLKIRTA